MANFINVRRVIHILAVTPRPHDGPLTNLKIVRRNTAIVRIPVLVAVDDLYVVIDVGRSAYDVRYRLANGACIVGREALSLAIACAHAIDLPTAGLIPDHVLAQSPPAAA